MTGLMIVFIALAILLVVIFIIIHDQFDRIESTLNLLNVNDKVIASDVRMISRRIKEVQADLDELVVVGGMEDEDN